MLNNLFGADLSYIAQFVLAFLVVLALIAGTFWLMRRFGAARLGGDKARGRQPRLAVIDAAAVDSRRRLILIRRDNVEHLIMIGGPSDVVIEQNIVRAVPVAPAREAPPPRGPGETATRGTDMVRPDPLPRPAAPADAAWSPPPLPEGIRPRAEPPPRASEPARPLPDSLLPPRAPTSDPRQPPTRGSAELAAVEVRQSPPTADVNLADMAQRLEAALRRPGQAPDARAEPPMRPAAPHARPTPPPRPVPAPESIMPPIPRVTPPRPVSPPPEPAAPPVARSAPPPPSAPIPSAPPTSAPPSSAPSPSASSPSASSPSVEPLRAPDPAPTQAPPQPPPASAAAPEPPKPEVPAKPKTVFDSLEEEMASLLGRPPDKP